MQGDSLDKRMTECRATARSRDRTFVREYTNICIWIIYVGCVYPELL
jgi:hypothetical protein